MLATEGYPRVSFTRVAAEAGISVGLIQHYFASKDELLRFAYDDTLRRGEERVRRRIDDGEVGDLPAAEALLEVLAELLPLDEERCVEYRVRQSLQTQALHDAELAEVARRSGGDLLRHVMRVIEEAAATGPRSVDAETGARMILATVQGLGEQITLSGADAFSARDVLRPVIAAAFDGR